MEGFYFTLYCFGNILAYQGIYGKMGRTLEGIDKKKCKKFMNCWQSPVFIRQRNLNWEEIERF